MSEEAPRSALGAGPSRQTSQTPLMRVRSTLLCSGLSELRARNLYERYRENLDARGREAIEAIVAGVWLPVSVGMSHFHACDSLGMSDEEAFDIGAASGRRIQQSVINTLVRLAAGAGTTPWTILDNYGRLWSRTFDGGSFAITKKGPKEARIDLSGMPPARFAYFRNAFRGAHHAGLSMFAAAMYVRELPSLEEDTLAYRISWA